MTGSGKKVLLVVIILGAILSLGVLFSLSSPGTQVKNGDQVGRIYLSGPIQDSFSGFGSEAITPSYVASRLKEAKEKNLEAVVLRVNSPGGSVASSQEIYNLLQDFEKPVIVSVGDMSASGGYYISSAADEIVAQPGSMTGSIGVISTFVNPEELYDKLGIEMQTIKSGKHKDMFSRELRSEERELMQELSDNAYNQFIDHIVEGRGMEKEKVKELATGEIFTGEQARENGLVDQLGGMDKALERAGSLADLEDPVYYDFSEPGLFEKLRSFSINLPQLVYKSVVSPEVLIIEKLESGLSPAIQYKVPGY
ncbi:MAG: signal peptide peptidase SppA [Bacillota bacterium]